MTCSLGLLGLALVSSAHDRDSGVLSRLQCSQSARRISKMLHGPNSGVTRQELSDLPGQQREAWPAQLLNREEVTKWARLGSSGARLAVVTPSPKMILLCRGSTWSPTAHLS